MFDTSPSGLLALVRSGESERVELKSAIPPDNVLARELIAFANSGGGILIVGVDDHGGVVGLPEIEAKRTAQRLQELSSLMCQWATRVGVAELDTNRKLVFLEIDPAPEHLSPAMTANGEAYKRVGSHTVQITDREILRMLGEDPRRTASGRLSHPPNRPCIVFVAMSFRQEQEPALVDYFNAILRAVERTGLDIQLRRVDLMDGDYEISQKLMDEIASSDVVLADFTLNSANVYFEVGYARGCNKRVIQVARKDTALEFDVRNWRTITYRNATELEERIILELQAAHEEVMSPGGEAS